MENGWRSEGVVLMWPQSQKVAGCLHWMVERNYEKWQSEYYVPSQKCGPGSYKIKSHYCYSSLCWLTGLQIIYCYIAINTVIGREEQVRLHTFPSSGSRSKWVVKFAVGCWKVPRAGLDDLEKWNVPCSCRDSNPRSPALSVVTLPTTLSRLPNEIQFCIYDNIMYVYRTRVQFCYQVGRSIVAILERNFLCGSNIGLYCCCCCCCWCCCCCCCWCYVFCVVVEANAANSGNMFRFYFRPSWGQRTLCKTYDQCVLCYMGTHITSWARKQLRI